MQSGESRPSEQTAYGDIEMQLPTRKDKVVRTIVTTVEREEALLSPSPPNIGMGNIVDEEELGKRTGALGKRLTR
jgi:hypothetical protein